MTVTGHGQQPRFIKQDSASQPWVTHYLSQESVGSIPLWAVGWRFFGDRK